MGSVIVARGLSCSEAHGFFSAQGLNPCPLHQQADSYPLYSGPLIQGSGLSFLLLSQFDPEKVFWVFPQLAPVPLASTCPLGVWTSLWVVAVGVYVQYCE